MNISIDPVAHVKFHLLLLQQEEYDVPRYLRTVFKKRGRVPTVFRKPLVYTAKMRIISGVSVLFHILSAYVLAGVSGWTPLFLVAVILFCYVHFIFLVLASSAFYPFDLLVKTVIISKAKRTLCMYPEVKVIAIAGSYGKTLMKEAVSAVLSTKYTVLKTPENVNTPLGIARLILHDLNNRTQFLVVELGEYQKGDIRQLAQFVQPTIGIITGINEAHLERMGTIENTADAIFELAENVNPEGFLVLNASDVRVKQYTASHTPSVAHVWYCSSRDDKSPVSIRNFRVNQDGTGSTWDMYEKMKKIMHIKSKLLPQYATGTCMAAYLIGNRLGIGGKDSLEALERISPAAHRLQPIVNTTAQILVIDDSYNGNPDGVAAAIEVLGSFTKRRKLFITPGLVEMGDQSERVHDDIGRRLARVADLVLLVDNSVTPFIRQGLTSEGFDKTRIITYPDAVTLHQKFSEYIKPGDVVLFQNDWSDNYS